MSSDTKGCLGWIAATIGWWILWGLCRKIGDVHKISPFIVLLVIIIGFIVIAGISIFIYYLIEDKIYEKHEKRVMHIQKEYGLAYRKFIDSNRIQKDITTGKITELSELKKISSREDSVWEQEEKKYKEELERENKKRKEYHEKAEKIKKEYPDGVSVSTMTYCIYQKNR